MGYWWIIALGEEEFLTLGVAENCGLLLMTSASSAIRRWWRNCAMLFACTNRRCVALCCMVPSFFFSRRGRVGTLGMRAPKPDSTCYYCNTWQFCFPNEYGHC